MKLDAVLKRLGIVVRSGTKGAHTLTMTFRVPQESVPIWTTGIEEFLLAIKKKTDITADVSKSFYLDDNDSLRWTWRVVLGGEERYEGLDYFALALQRTQASTVDVQSMPLVGRKEYTGETRGFYSTAGSEASAVAADIFKGAR